jgi:DNA-binding transcriptional LysR family regulator
MSTRFTARQLEALMAVAECGGFAAAGRSLGISQPAVSKHVRALEHRLGYRLFDVDPGSAPRLTARGRLMVEELPNLLERLQSVSGTVAAPTDQRAIVRIGTGDTLAEAIADCLPGLYHDVPNVSVELRSFDPSLTSALRLEDEGVDLAYLTLRAPHTDRIGEPIAPVHGGLYIHPDRVSGDDWATSESLPFISAPDNSFLSREFEQAVKLCGIPAHHVVARIPSGRDRIKLALAGIGATLAIDHMVRPHVERDELRRIGARTIALQRCRFVNPMRYADRAVRQVDRFLTRSLASPDR